MAVTVEEMAKGRVETRAGKNSMAKIPYLVKGAANEAEALTGLTDLTVDVYRSLPRRGIELAERIDSNPVKWRGIVTYAGPDYTATSETVPPDEFYFDTSGGREHITNAIATINTYGDADANLDGAIGWDGATIKGLDIGARVFNFSEKHFFKDSEMTSAYITKLFNGTFTVNDDTFKTYAAGECLFLGASGGQRGDGLWALTFKFSASPNRTTIMVGSIGPITRKGYEHLDIRYLDDIDATSKRLIRVPKAVTVLQVYETSDFADLGIGT